MGGPDTTGAWHADGALLAAYHDQRLDAAARWSVEAHLTSCADCRLPLELPAVHFLCKHSYHQRCLRGGEAGGGGSGGRGGGGGGGGGGGSAAAIAAAAGLRCPQCSGKNDVIRSYRQQQVEGAGKHEVFKADLERSSEPFKTVAEWFGRGVMGAASIE